MTPNHSVHRIVAIIRGSANIALGIGAIILLIALAMHWPPEIIAPIGLLTIAAFLISFFSIIIENRLPETPNDEEEGPTR